MLLEDPRRLTHDCGPTDESLEGPSMKLLITGVCGFVGGAIVEAYAEAGISNEIVGIDNLSRPGSELNRRKLQRAGVKVVHGDLRSASDLETLPPVDWVIDAAANPSVLAGIDGGASSRQVVENNLIGTVNLLEYCRRHRAGLILLSTSRVYSMPALAALDLEVKDGAFRRRESTLAKGLDRDGINEGFSTTPPISLYGATKLASECLALEYGEAFGFPVWINRCGVLAGAGQFGRTDQGIFAFWIHSWRARSALRYLGFGGHGYQVRDALHPRDLVPVLEAQTADSRKGIERIQNLGGGPNSALSLLQLSNWCESRFGKHSVTADPNERPNDVPWVVLSSARAGAQWGWQPQTSLEDILVDIAEHAESHPDWLALSQGT